MKTYYILPLFIIIFLFSCSDNEQAKEETTQKTSVTANTIANIEVSGMACEMACGGAIRKALLENKGVTRVQFDFEMNRDTNIAKVSYDRNKINAEKIKSIILKVNDGQFTVGEITEEPLSSNTESTQNSGNTTIEMNEIQNFEFPNLLSIIAKLLPV